MSIVRLATGVHAAVQSLLPWYVSRRLDGDDVAKVEAHLADCAGCRADLDVERKLQAAYPLSGAAADAGSGVERGLALALQRIDAGAQRPQRAGGIQRWLRWALGAQLAVIVVLAMMLRPAEPPAGRYRSLGAPDAPAAATAVVVFRPDATEQQIRTALRASDARLVDGPTATNAYLLKLPATGAAAALDRLRAQPAVALAESLDAAAPP